MSLMRKNNENIRVKLAIEVRIRAKKGKVSTNLTLLGGSSGQLFMVLLW